MKLIRPMALGLVVTLLAACDQAPAPPEPTPAPEPAAPAVEQPKVPAQPVEVERTVEAKPEQPPAPPHTSTTPGQGGEASAAANAPQATATPSSAKPESPPPTFPIPAGGLRHEVQGLLVNMLAGNLLDETDTPIPRPRDGVDDQSNRATRAANDRR